MRKTMLMFLLTAVPSMLSVLTLPSNAGGTDTQLVSSRVVMAHTLAMAKDHAVAVPVAGKGAARMPLYKPPKRGAPGGRVGGGTRGFTPELPAPVALAPDHVGLTTKEQPSLYWYISTLTDHPFELTVIEQQAVDPVLETALPQPTSPGVQRIRLADYGVRLSPEKEYQWFVALVSDPEHRSKDILAGGRIKRIDAPEKMRPLLAQADSIELTHIFAQFGLWYDALESASQSIEEHRDDATVAALRAALLDQIGLADVAASATGSSGF